MAEQYPLYFRKYIETASSLDLLGHELVKYDLDRLGKALQPERDHLFTYLGLQTLYDRYFIHTDEQVRIELPAGCSLCAWRWAWPLTNWTGKTRRSNSMNCCLPSTS